MLTIRPERSQDYDAIAEVHRLAFGQDDEARLVADLRRTKHFVPELSMVAVCSGQVVGHVLFSAVHIETPQGPVPALALAPMAVRPEFQNRCIGTELARQGLEACRKLGHRIVLVVGHPEYYPRFGFTPAVPHGLRVPFPVPDEAFMVLPLVSGALDGVTGTVAYPPEFFSA